MTLTSPQTPEVIGDFGSFFYRRGVSLCSSAGIRTGTMGYMSSDDAFIQTILNNPDEDSPRLVYADWLRLLIWLRMLEKLAIAAKNP
jgi:hypothetical protein